MFLLLFVLTLVNITMYWSTGSGYHFFLAAVLGVCMLVESSQLDEEETHE